MVFANLFFDQKIVSMITTEDMLRKVIEEWPQQHHRRMASAFVVVDVYTAGTRDFDAHEDEILYKVGCRCLSCGYEQPFLFGNSGCGNDDKHYIFHCTCRDTQLEIVAKFFSWFSSLGRDHVNRAVRLPLPARKRFHCFLSHDWSEGGVNHRIVQLIKERLANKGIIAWIDDERIAANIRPAINEGLRDSVVFIAFLTKNYAKKLSHAPAVDYCSYEYREAARLFPGRRLPVALEEGMRNAVTWPEPLADLRDVLLTDMVGVDNNIKDVEYAMR